MKKIIDAIDRLQLTPKAHIDRNFRQGREAVFSQLYQRTMGGEKDTSKADQFIRGAEQDIASLHTWVTPYHLPDDYVFFLEFYGGLEIEATGYYFSVHGIGPMVEDWYDFIMGDEGTYENGLLLIGRLSFRGERSGECVYFFLDLASIVHRFCIIGIHLGELQNFDVLTVIQHLDIYQSCWTKLANSFTGWLEQAAETHGTFGYIDQGK